MSDISNQLIKNSYDYVLQSDLSTGIVYRIGGAVPVNPIFLSGLTINSGFTYSNGTEQNGYVLTCDPFGNAKWAPVSGTTPTSGVTSITTGIGLSGDSTTGAVTIINTAPDQTVTITGGTNIQINGTYPNFGIDFTGTTGGGDYLPLSGGTVTGGTVFQSGLTATTISATTYLGIPEITISGGTGITTGGTYPNFTITNSSPDQTVTISGGTGITTGGTYPNFTLVNSAPDQVVTITGGTNIQINGSYPNFGVNYTGQTSYPYLPLSGGTVTGATNYTAGLTANTFSATTYQNLPVSAVTNGMGISTSTTNGTATITNTAPDQTVTISGGTGITTGGTYPNFTLVNSAPDQTVSISGGTGITTGGTYPNFTLVNSAPDQTVSITGGTNIQINGSYPNFGIDFTGGTILKYFVSGSTPSGTINDGDRWFNTNDGVELVYVTDGDGPQWVQPNNGGSNSGQTITITGGTNIEITGSYPNFGVNFTGTTSGGDYLPISGGTVTGNTTFSSGVALNALTSSEEINNIVADSAGNLYTYTDGVTISAGSDPAVNSGMFKTNRTVDIGGTLYRVYNIKGNVRIPGGGNTFVNYIGVVSGSTNYTPSLTKSLVTAQDPTFNRVQTPLTTYALVYDETLLFAAPVDLMTVNYDNTLGNPDEYYIFSIAANTNNFSCDLQVDYEFLVLETDVITFTN